jgi:exo-beta-1,3-glucanase (GH17 family)
MKPVLIGMMALLAAATLANGAEEHMILKGLAYGPFRDGQRPGGPYPDEAQIRADLDLMKRIAPKIRTYGTEQTFAAIPDYCAEIGLDCYPGAWLDRTFLSNQEQTQTLIDIAARGHPTTKGLIVGNEVLLRGDLSQSNLIAYIEAVKASTTVPVTTAESFHFFLDEAFDPLADAVDFLCIHIHPWWYNVHVSNAVYLVAEAYTLVKNRFPDKEVIVGEVGWPSDGFPQNQAAPTLQNAARFLGELQGAANYLDMDYFYFSAFDEAWKVESFGVGPHWGVLHADRTPKATLTELVAYYGSILGAAPSELILATFAGAEYEVEFTENPVHPAWVPVGRVFGEGGTNSTAFPLPVPVADCGVYRYGWVPP